MNKAQKESKFAEIFQENRDRVYRLCCGFVSDPGDVDDLFQEIMLNIWKNLSTFRGEAQINTWIYRITVNSALLFRKRAHRKKQHQRPLEQQDLAHPASEGIPAVQQMELEKLHAGIRRLQKSERLLISLLLEGLSYKEMAEILGISVSHVGVKINRAKKALEKLMKE